MYKVLLQLAPIFSVILYAMCFFSFPNTSFGESRFEKNDSFTSSNLPIFVINTHSHTIKDEPKISATLGVIDNGFGNRNNTTDPYNGYYGEIGIELRGNSTQGFPKKPYLFETRDSLGENLDVSLLGMPADNDWILLASYIDRTLIRDPLAFYLSSLTRRWSSRFRFCEVVINNDYKGIYILTEKIKRGKNRVDVKKLTPDDTTENSISGGYIYEVTGFGGDLGDNRKLHYPDYDDLNRAQLEYLKNYDDEFRNVMTLPTYDDPTIGYEKWIDTQSFIDEILVQELMRNSDAYGWSSYFHKDLNKKLAAGPVWDFDQSAGNSTYLHGAKTTGWVLNYETSQPFFWKILFYDKTFRAKLKLRWIELKKDKFTIENILSFIDSCANYLEEAQARNFNKWSILGKFIWRETEGYEQRDTYQKEVDYLKQYMTKRFEWMDEQLMINTDVNLNENLPGNFYLHQNFPNPFNPGTVISWQLAVSSLVTLKVYNILGNEVASLVNEEKPAGSYSIEWRPEGIASGIYFCRMTTRNFTSVKKMIYVK